MKKIFTVIIILLIILISPNVYAATQDMFYEGDYIAKAYIKKLHNGKGTYKQMKFIIRKNDGMFAYCIEPWETLVSNHPYEESYNIHSLDDETLEHINTIAYYGYGYQNHTDPIWYAVTQIAIWRYIQPTDEFYFTETLNGTRTTKFDFMFQELNALVNQTSVLSMSKNSSSFLLGTNDTIIITGNLNQYNIQASEQLNITIQNQTINIESKVEGIYSINITEKEMNHTNIPLIYQDSNSQTLLVVGSKKTQQYTIPVKVFTGSIKILKRDSTTLEKPLGDASLKGSKFEIKNKNGTFQKTVTIPDSLEVSINDLPADTYYITETQAGIGYQKNNLVKTVVLDSNTHTVSVTYYNDVIKKEIKIYKSYGTTDQLWPEADAVFEIYHDGEVVAVIQTNENGYGSVVLPYGTYQVKQISGKEGYDYVPEFTVNIDDNEKELIYPLTDYLKTGCLTIYKRDWDSKEIIESNDFQFQITNIETQKKHTISTLNGVATLYNLLPGKYIIQEINSKAGYCIDTQPIMFEITEESIESSNTIIPIDIYNKKIKVPNTEANSPSYFSIWATIFFGGLIICIKRW